MSGIKRNRKKTAVVLGQLGTAAVIATLTGVPGELVKVVFKSHDTSSMAFAKQPPSPPPPPATPAPQPLNADPSTHWFAAWDENIAPGAMDFFATPHLDNSTIANVQAQLNVSASAAVNKPLGVKVQTPIFNSTATAVFGGHYPLPNGSKAVSYVFGDMETGTTSQQISNVTTLVSQVRGSFAANAYVGQFDLTPTSTSAYTRPSTLTYSASQYNSSKVNMANTALYPGAPSFRNASTGDWANANIRTGLFIAPIGRLTEVQNALNSGYKGTETTTVGLNYHKQIPWVARFNNWGNASLDNVGTTADGYQFAQNAAIPSQGQLMSRGDFSAQILHGRMRGVYSVNLFHEGGASGSLVGYSAAQAQDDVRAGWYGLPHTDAIFAKSDNKVATMTLNPQVDGGPAMGGNQAERTGTVWSGVYSLSAGQLDILASNLDTVGHWIKFGMGDTAYDIFTVKTPNGYTYSVNDSATLDDNNSRNAQIEAGIHKLLQFDLVQTRIYGSRADALAGSNNANKYSLKTVWLLNSKYNVFTDDNRNGVGIPEPTSVGMLAAAGTMALVCRRRRQEKKA